MPLTKVSFSMIDGAPLNANDFGVVGDGVANDSVALIAALNAAVSTGKTLIVTGTVLINGWTKFLPAGALSIKGVDCVIKTTESAISFTSVGNGGKFSIDGVVFEGFNAVVNVTEDVDIETFNFCNNTIKDGVTGVLWQPASASNFGYDEAFVCNNVFKDMVQTGVFLRPRRMQVTKINGNVLQDFLNANGSIDGIVAGLSTSAGIERTLVEMTGNSFNNFEISGTGTNLFALMVHEAENYVVANNNFKNLKKTESYINSVRAIHTRAGAGIISNNVIENVRGTAINVLGGQTIAHITHVNGNTISTDNATEFLGILVRNQDAVITNNFIDGANVGIAATHPQVDGTFRTEVYNNNTIRNSHLCGIQINLNRRGLQMVGNNITIMDNDPNAAVDSNFPNVPAGIYVGHIGGGNSRNVIMSGNMIQDIDADALFFSSGVGDTLQGGIISSNLFATISGEVIKTNNSVLKIFTVEDNIYQAATTFSTTVFDRTNQISFNNGGLVASLATTVNDFSVGYSDIAYLTSVSSSRNVTGLSGGFSGRKLTVINAGASLNVGLANQNAGSAAENRIFSSTGADVVLTPGACANLVYDAGEQRWRIVSTFI